MNSITLIACSEGESKVHILRVGEDPRTGQGLCGWRSKNPVDRTFLKDVGGDFALERQCKICRKLAKYEGLIESDIDPGVEDMLRPELDEWINHYMKFQNAIGQDDHIDSWEEALWAAGDMEIVLEKMLDKIHGNIHRHEEELEDEYDKG